MPLDGLLFSEEQWTPGEKGSKGWGRGTTESSRGKEGCSQDILFENKKEKTFILF